MKTGNHKEYSTGRMQKGQKSILDAGEYAERDGILLHPECRDGLFLNAHPSHWAMDEEEYREMGEARGFGPSGRGRSRDSQVE